MGYSLPFNDTDVAGIYQGYTCKECNEFAGANFSVCDAIWAYLTIPILLLLASLIITIDAIRTMYCHTQSMNNNNNNIKIVGNCNCKQQMKQTPNVNVPIKVKGKFKILCLLISICYLITIIASILQVYFDNYCEFLVLVEFGFVSLDTPYLVGGCLTIILFIQRLNHAVKNSIFEMKQSTVIGFHCVAIFEFLLIVTHIVESQLYLNGVDSSYEFVGPIYVAIERLIYFIITPILLYTFIKRFRMLRQLFVNSNSNTLNKLNQTIIKQTVLASITLTSSMLWLIWQIIYIIVNVATFEKNEIDIGTEGIVYRVSEIMLCLDCFINIVCIHAYFPHGYKFYKLFGCEKCVNKLYKRIYGNSVYITTNVPSQVEIAPM